MLQHLISTPRKVTRAPRRLLIGLRYHISGIWEEVCNENPQRTRIKTPKETQLRNLSFTYAVIALSARVARSDNGLTRERYIAFRDAFPLQDNMCDKIRELFMLACEDATPTEYYTAQIMQLFPKQHALRALIISRLFAIACADGTLSKADDWKLARISHLLGISAMRYSQIRTQQFEKKTPHELLGVEEKAPLSAIKKRYRELMQRYHPDRYAGNKISQELEMLLQLRSSEINDAYGQMSKRAA